MTPERVVEIERTHECSGGFCHGCELLDAVVAEGKRREEAEAKWYRSNRELHAAWKERDAALREADRLKDEAAWAWAAGVYEGEGTACVVKDRRPDRYPKSRLRVFMTDEDIVRRLAKIVGCGSVSGPYDRGEGKKDAWAWNLSRLPEIRMIRRRFGPYLGIRRTKQMDTAISAHVVRHHSDNVHRCACGRLIRGNTIVKHARVCKTARNEEATLWENSKDSEKK